MQLSEYKNWNLIKPFVENNITPITGFGEFGSISTIKYITFNNFFNLEFNFKLIDEPSNSAALLDLDFNDILSIYFSLIFEDGSINFITNDKSGKNQKSIFIYDLINDEWNNIKVSFKNKKINIHLNNLDVFEYSFKDKIYSVKPWIGNNWGTQLKLKNECILIKDISLMFNEHKMKKKSEAKNRR